MAKLNGTDMLVYCDGTVIAYQKECTINWEQDLPPSTTKASSGWEEHINGTRRASCDFTALFSTTGLSDDELIGYITGRDSVVLLIDGGGFPIVGKASLKNVSINAAQEDPASISGTFNFSGGCWMLAGDSVNLVTDPDGDHTYDVYTTTGIQVSAGQNTGVGAQYGRTNTFTLSADDVCQLVLYVPSLAGTDITVDIYNTASGLTVTDTPAVLTEGVTLVTFGAITAGGSSYFKFSSTGESYFETGDIYLFVT